MVRRGDVVIWRYHLPELWLDTYYVPARWTPTHLISCNAKYMLAPSPWQDLSYLHASADGVFPKFRLGSTSPPAALLGCIEEFVHSGLISKDRRFGTVQCCYDSYHYFS